jgi:hypothetical protein
MASIRVICSPAPTPCLAGLESAEQRDIRCYKGALLSPPSATRRLWVMGVVQRLAPAMKVATMYVAWRSRDWRPRS